MLFTRATFDNIQRNILGNFTLNLTRFHVNPVGPLELRHLKLTQPELTWLRSTCPYFTEAYLNYLLNFQFHPIQQITLSFAPIPVDDSNGIEYGHLELSIAGNWAETILYEVICSSTPLSDPFPWKSR